MTRTDFISALNEAAVLCQDQYKPGTSEVYFNEFGDWPYDDFRFAICDAARNSSRFPSVRQIMDCKPRDYSTGELKKIHNMENGILDRKPVELPEHLKSLTDNQIRQMFADAGYVGDIHVGMIRRGNSLWIEELDDISRGGTRWQSGHSAGYS